MTFQKQVQIYPPVGNEGAIASMNPLATVAAGPGGLVAGANGVIVGRFAWNTYPVAGGPGQASNACSGAPRKPDGFICNEQQGLITQWLGTNSLGVPNGYMVTEHVRGDFWAVSEMAEAVIGNKVFANLLSGRILPAAAGAFPTNAAGTAASVTASLIAGSYTMTISATGSGVPKVGQLVTGAGLDDNTYIESIGTYNGSTGTVFLSKAALLTETGKTYATSLPEAYGGWVGTATFATDEMTVVSTTSGALVVGQLVKSAGVADGTYIVADLGAGVYQLSTTPGTITPAQAASASAWIETDWYVKSAGNVNDLIKIGVN